MGGTDRAVPAPPLPLPHAEEAHGGGRAEEEASAVPAPSSRQGRGWLVPRACQGQLNAPTSTGQQGLLRLGLHGSWMQWGWVLCPRPTSPAPALTASARHRAPPHWMGTLPVLPSHPQAHQGPWEPGPSAEQPVGEGKSRGPGWGLQQHQAGCLSSGPRRSHCCIGLW